MRAETQKSSLDSVAWYIAGTSTCTVVFIQGKTIDSRHCLVTGSCLLSWWEGANLNYTEIVPVSSWMKHLPATILPLGHNNWPVIMTEYNSYRIGISKQRFMVEWDKTFRRTIFWKQIQTYYSFMHVLHQKALPIHK